MIRYELSEPYNEIQQYNTNYPRHRHLLILDDYEVANLKRLLYAVAGRTGESDDPIVKFNNGDWVGQIGWYLPDVKHEPNLKWPEEMKW